MTHMVSIAALMAVSISSFTLTPISQTRNLQQQLTSLSSAASDVNNRSQIRRPTPNRIRDTANFRDAKGKTSPFVKHGHCAFRLNKFLYYLSRAICKVSTIQAQWR